MGLPISRVSARASSSMFSISRSAIRCRIACRLAKPKPDHTPESKASRAAATARSASADDPRATRAHGSREYGSMSNIS